MTGNTVVSRAARKAVLAGVTTASIVALAACSSSGSNPSGTSPSSTQQPGASSAGSTTQAASDATSGVADAKAAVAKYTAGIPIVEPAKIAPMPNIKGKTIWFIPIGNSVPVISLVGTSMTDALSKLGATTHVCDGNFLPTAVAQCMDQAATQGADMVVTAYVDYSLIPIAYENLVKKHIPVLVAGAAAPASRQSDKSLAFFDTGATTIMVGRVGSDAAIADSNGKADILYVNLTDSASTMKATKAAQDEVQAKCPDCKFQTIDMQTSKATKVPSAVSAKLIADPSIDYVLNVNDSFVPLIISGVNNAGRTGKVKVISGSADPAGLQRVKAGEQLYDVGAAPTVSGWAIADAALRLLAGSAPVQGTESGAKLFRKDNVGGLVLTPEKYHSNEWYGGNGFEQAFLTAWGV